jgi:5-hydroxyisourate hydrolase-like protein (transthyretin family)
MEHEQGKTLTGQGQLVRWVGSAMVVAVAIGMAPPAFGCSCSQPSSPCASIMDKEAVIFIGTPVAAEPATFTSTGIVALGPRAGEPVTQREDAVRYRFTVHEWLHANIDAPTIALITATDTAACGYPFQIGESYLVYAHESTNGLRAGFCSRTGPVAERQDDITLLRETQTGSPQTRLVGTVYSMRLLTDGGFFHYTPLTGVPNVKIAIAGQDGTHQTSTDDRGEFKVVGLAPGNYEVTPALPPNLQLMFKPEGPLKLDECLAEIGFAVVTTPLAGIVRNQDGSPATKNVKVTVVRVDDSIAAPSRGQSTLSFTNADGTWKFQGLAPGRYRLGLNLFDPPDPDSPYPSVWYPNAQRAADARILELSDDRTEPVEFRAPKTIPRTVVQGIVLDPTGAPALNASVLLYDSEQPRSHVSNATTGADGRFSVPALERRRYRIQASHFTISSGTLFESELKDVPDDTTNEPLTLVLAERKGKH